MPDAKPWSAIVMPCLNEEHYLRSACESLGFGGGDLPPSACYLILVDNGSTDTTLDQCQQLQDDVGASIVIVQEPVRGHVPARHRGNLVAAQLAAADGVADTEAVIIQTDADTCYSSRYVDRVRNVFSDSPSTGIFVQATTQFPADLCTRYPTLFTAIDAIDVSVEQRFGPQEYDVVVDDKACAYTLYDYFRWGAHRREYFDDGCEILAETTRLMIAARTHGVQRLHIDTASAIHSQRRLLTDTEEQLSTAGFPYSTKKKFTDTKPITLDELERLIAADDYEIFDAIRVVRTAHLVALMILLPAHLERTLTGTLPTDYHIRHILELIPKRSIKEASHTPGHLIGDVLNLVQDTQSPLYRTLN